VHLYLVRLKVKLRNATLVTHSAAIVCRVFCHSALS